MSVIKKTIKCFLPEPLKRLATKVLFGDLSRFSAKNPRRFDWENIDDAKKSILWCADWDEATEYTIELMQKSGVIKAESFVVDWGCGVGRIASELVERYNANVLAVDRSVKMLRHALSYVKPQYLSNTVFATDEFILSHINIFENCANLIIFIEVFQHIPKPVLDCILPRIERLLKKNGKLFVFGNKQLDVGYKDRGPSTVEEVIKRHFELKEYRTAFQRYAGKVANLLYDPIPRYIFVAERKRFRNPARIVAYNK
jgi:cyclopropane fatty-acyl-phospholipid synthase-like methyltransferase